MDVLHRIGRLQAALNSDARIEDSDTWWTDFRLIESEIEGSPHASKRERELLDQVKRGLSDFTLAIRSLP